MKTDNKTRIKNMDLLGNILRDSGIPFKREIEVTYRNLFGEEGFLAKNQIKLDEHQGSKHIFFSAICHIGSYGYQDGTIEVWFGTGNPAAYCTIDEAFKLIKEYWECIGGADEI